MRPLRWLAALWLAIVLVPSAAVRAQQITPHVGYVYPAGGQRGATLEVKVGGQYLDGASKVHVSGSGMQAEVVEYVKPLTQGQFNQLREKLQELMKQKKDAAAWQEIAEIRKKLATFVRRPATPAIAETVTLRVTIDPDADPGERELRLAASGGVSNPLVFCVGQLPEFCEQGPKSSADEISSTAKSGKTKNAKEPSTRTEAKDSAADAEMNLTLPAIVNGQIMPSEADRTRLQARQPDRYVPGDVDRYRFQAQRGQQLVVAASARELVPYLADAVPGWFQATLALYDAAGKELAYDDDYRFHPDPVLFCKIPEDGQYTIEIKDALYRGRGDFVYRIALGELPFVTSTFPLGGRAGGQTTVELKGWNLPVDKLTMDATDKAPGIYPLSVCQGELVSNRVPFAVDTLPECLEKEPNNSPASAQPVTLPVIVNGRIDQPGDWDVFRFEGRAGDQVVAEVDARRLDSPLDSVLKLTDASGRQLAFNDDHEDKGSGLNTHHADSLLSVTLPDSGTYFVHLGDAQHQGGAEYAYRLRISAPRPDFALRIVPSSISARAGMNVPITVYALRKDGFSGEIALALKDAPQGFTLSGGLVPAGRDEVRLTLTAPPMPPQGPIRLLLEGRAMIQGQQVVRSGVPADDMMQAFAYRHLVPAKDLMVSVMGRPRSQATAGLGRKLGGLVGAVTGGGGGTGGWLKVLGEKPVKIPAGGTAEVRIAVPAIALKDQLQLELSDPPEGIAIENISPVEEGLMMVLHSDAEKAKPGLKGNLIVNASMKRAAAAGAKTRGAGPRFALGTLPAIPFEVVEP